MPPPPYVVFFPFFRIRTMIVNSHELARKRGEIPSHNVTTSGVSRNAEENLGEACADFEEA